MVVVLSYQVLKLTELLNTTRTPSPEQYGNVSGYRRAPNKAFVYDASFVKLREVNITYTLPTTYSFENETY